MCTCRYTRGNKREDPNIYVDIRKEKVVVNKGKIANWYVPMIVPEWMRTHTAFFWLNKLTGW